MSPDQLTRTNPVPSREQAALPSVDVVIATHDRPELVRKAVDAVWGQTYQGTVECIVVFDKAEPDRSLERTAPNRVVRVIANDRSSGLAGARNSGIDAGSAEFVAFCDDDDEWLPSKLEQQVDLMEASTALTSVTGVHILYGDRKAERVPRQATFTLQNLVRNRVMEGHPSSVLVRRKPLMEEIGLIDEAIPGSYGEDFDWILRAAQAGGIAVVESPLVNVRWGQSQFSQRWQTIVDAIDYGLEKHSVFHDDPAALARLYGRRAFALAALGRRREALRGAARTLRSSPRELRGYLVVAVAVRAVSARRLMDIAHKRGHGI